jgi:hypothetical protein
VSVSINTTCGNDTRRIINETETVSVTFGTNYILTLSIAREDFIGSSTG